MEFTARDFPFQEGNEVKPYELTMVTEIFDYLQSLNIKQLMSSGPMTYWNAPFHWKLFGSMFNSFGLCFPFSALNHTKMELHVATRKKILTPFQLSNLIQEKYTTLVFKGNEKGETHLTHLYNALCNFAVIKAMSELQQKHIPIIEVCNLIQEYIFFDTLLTCVWFNDAVREQLDQQEKEITENLKIEKELKRMQDIANEYEPKHKQLKTH